MAVTITNNYYKDNTDPLVLIGLKIAIEEYFYNLLFKDDTNKIIYSTTQFALQKRASNSNWSNALLPFLNYREISISEENTRQWRSFSNHKIGVYIDSLGIKLRFTPITLTFDSTLWYGTDRDCNIAYQRLIDDASAETYLKFNININDKPILFYGLLDFTELAYKPNFDQNDWLLKNQISTISCGFKVQTMLPLTRYKLKYSLTDKVILDFGRILGIDNNKIDEVYTAILNHFDENISDFNRV